MTTIIVTPQPQTKGGGEYHAWADDDPGNCCSGATVEKAVGSLVRSYYDRLDLIGLTDRDLQVEYGVHWDDMTDSELGHLVQQCGLLTIDVKDYLPPK